MTGLANQAGLTAATGAPERIYWGCHDSPMGPLLLGVTREGLCRLEFISSYGLSWDLARWHEEWPATRLIPDAAASAAIAGELRRMRPLLQGHAPLALYGTEFQLKVWKALLQIAPGKTISQAEIAALIGKPGAGKAVGLALNANPVPLLVPCHRVLSEDVFSKIPPDRRRMLMALEELAALDFARGEAESAARFHS